MSPETNETAFAEEELAIGDETPGAETDTASAADRSGADAADARPGELTETQLEALLFVAERPLSRSEIAALTGVDRETVDARIGDLQVSLAERGIRLVESGERVELATAPDAGRLIARYVGADAPRLSGPSLETLAIVAYRQPCTRATIERIRGVDSDYTLRTLMHRRLVMELGRSEAPGRPILFGTGFDFLERFGLTSLDQLPPLEAAVAERLFVEPDEELPSQELASEELASEELTGTEPASGEPAAGGASVVDDVPAASEGRRAADEVGPEER